MIAADPSPEERGVGGGKKASRLLAGGKVQKVMSMGYWTAIATPLGERAGVKL